MARRTSASLPVMRERACSYSMRYMRRTTHSPISDTTGCNASTARGTCCKCSISTTTALARPAMQQAIVMRFTSPNPEKRHMLRGMPAATNVAR
jgi:hypothetical protein